VRLTGSLALKWTLAIALLLVLGMGLLGAYLIAQQEGAFERHSNRLGQLLADQLARSASEPLLAEDVFQLELLVRRQLDDGLVIGAAVFDREGGQRAGAGAVPEQAGFKVLSDAPATDWIEQVGDAGERYTASVYYRPIEFQDVKAGHALLALNRAPLERDRRVLVKALVATTALLIGFVGALAFPLAHWMSEPIRRLVRQELAERRELPSLPPPVRRASDELSFLADRLQRLSIDAAGKRQIEEALNRYLSPGVARSVLAAPEGSRLGGQSLHGSVLFCDIVDFTRLSRSLPPEELAALVNDYFGAFAIAGALCRGTVDKFIGDCVMILFGVPEPDDEHGLNAVICGSAIVRLAAAINVRRRALGQPVVSFRVAVNSGLMQAGNLGSLDRMEFTVVGSSVNLAARLCERSPENSLALSADTLAELGVAEQVVVGRLGPLRLKGYDDPVQAFRVESLHEPTEARVRACLEGVTDGLQEPV
jgi:adenylate cyclase